MGVTPLGFETLSAAAEADPEQKLFTAVDIMVPSLANLHETVGVEALNLGYHVHLEKPISESVESAERLVAAVPEGKVLMIAENSAYWREVVEAKRLIDAGTIGDVLTARCKYWESGHAVLNSWAAAGSYDKGGGCTRLRIGYLCSVCCVLSILLRLHGPRKPNYADVHNCDDVIRQRVEAGFVMAG